MYKRPPPPFSQPSTMVESVSVRLRSTTTSNQHQAGNSVKPAARRKVMPYLYVCSSLFSPGAWEVTASTMTMMTAKGVISRDPKIWRDLGRSRTLLASSKRHREPRHAVLLASRSNCDVCRVSCRREWLKNQKLRVLCVHTGREVKCQGAYVDPLEN